MKNKITFCFRAVPDEQIVKLSGQLTCDGISIPNVTIGMMTLPDLEAGEANGSSLVSMIVPVDESSEPIQTDSSGDFEFDHIVSKDIEKFECTILAIFANFNDDMRVVRRHVKAFRSTDGKNELAVHTSFDLCNNDNVYSYASRKNNPESSLPDIQFMYCERNSDFINTNLTDENGLYLPLNDLEYRLIRRNLTGSVVYNVPRFNLILPDQLDVLLLGEKYEYLRFIGFSNENVKEAINVYPYVLFIEKNVNGSKTLYIDVSEDYLDNSKEIPYQFNQILSNETNSKPVRDWEEKFEGIAIDLTSPLTLHSKMGDIDFTKLVVTF